MRLHNTSGIVLASLVLHLLVSKKIYRDAWFYQTIINSCRVWNGLKWRQSICTLDYDTWACTSKPHRERVLIVCNVQPLKQQPSPAMLEVHTIVETLKFCRGQQQWWLNIQVPCTRGDRNSRYASHNCKNTSPHTCKNSRRIPANSIFVKQYWKA